MTPAPYIVWRKTPRHCWRIWLPAHFAAAGLAPPHPTDPDALYAGDDYELAFAIAREANAQTPSSIPPRPSTPDRGMEGKRVVTREPGSDELPSLPSRPDFQETLF